MPSEGFARGKRE